MGNATVLMDENDKCGHIPTNRGTSFRSMNILMFIDLNLNEKD